VRGRVKKSEAVVVAVWEVARKENWRTNRTCGKAPSKKAKTIPEPWRRRKRLEEGVLSGFGG
jgi:hypothetical protein